MEHISSSTDLDKFTSTKELKILLWNIEGIKNWYEFERTEKEVILKHDIIAFVETWLEEDLNIYELRNYEKVEVLASRFYDSGRGSGGISVFYRNDKFMLCSLLAKEDHYIGIRLKFNNSHLLFFATYIQPYTSFDNIIDKLMEAVGDAQSRYPNDYIIVGGDFNARVCDLDHENRKMVIDWGDTRRDRIALDNGCNDRGKILLERSDEEGLLLLNGRTPGDIPSQYTFVNHSGGKSTIDLLFTSTKDICFCKSLQAINSTHSCHFPMSLELDFKIKTTLNLTKQLKWKQDKAEIFNELLMSSLNTSNKRTYENFCNAVYDAGEKAKIIHKNSTNKCTNKPWFNSKCKDNQIKCINELKQARNSDSPDKWSSYIKSKKSYKNLLKYTKKVYFKSIREKLSNVKNSSEFWKTVKHYKGKSFIPNKIPEKKWVDFYNSIQPKKHKSVQTYEGIVNDYLDKEISMEELETALKNSPNQKACGPDLIPNELYKNLTTEGKEWIKDILNEIMSTEIIPTTLPESFTAMIHKKGDEADPKNYRPISLLNHFLKLFTQIITNRLSNWAEENRVIPEAQGGFRKKRSCEDQFFA